MAFFTTSVTTSVTIKMSNYSEWMSKEFGVLLDNNEHSDILLLAEDGGSVKAHRAILLPMSTQLGQLCSKENEEDTVFLPNVKGSTLRCLVQLVYQGKCNVCRSEVEALLSLASSLGLDLPPKSLQMNVQPLDAQQVALGEAVSLNTKESSKESSDLKIKALPPITEEFPKSKARALKRLLKSLFHSLDQEGFKCLVCNKIMSHQSTAISHCEGHLNIRALCNWCPKSFKTRGGLSVHVKKRHRVKTFRRNSCAIQYDPIEMTRLRDKVANTEIATLAGKTHSAHQNLLEALDDLLLTVNLENDPGHGERTTTEGALEDYNRSRDVAFSSKRRDEQHFHDASTKFESVYAEANDYLYASKEEDLSQGKGLTRRKVEALLEGGAGEKLDIERAIASTTQTEKEGSDLAVKNVADSKSKLLELYPFLTCKICQGFLISATTITSCLHSFCKSCLVKLMLNKESALYHCPTCAAFIGGLNGIREDCQMQSIVNQLVPNLEKLEAERRKAFLRGPLTTKDHARRKK